MRILPPVLLGLTLMGCTPDDPGTSPTPDPTPGPGSTPMPASPTEPGPTPEPCQVTTGDKGGARLSHDGGITLQPSAHPQLSTGDFTWDVAWDPDDPHLVWELWTDALYRSGDGGCSFEKTLTLQDGYTDFTAGPPGSGIRILSSYTSPILLVSRDSGTSWQSEDIPYPVFDVGIDRANPEHWTLGGRDNCLYVRDNSEEKWTCRPVTPMTSGLATSLDWAEGTTGTWVVGDYDGFYRTTDRGLSWEVINDGLDTTLDGEEVFGWVPASITLSTDGTLAYAAINTVTLNFAERAIWRWQEDTHRWEKRVSERDSLDGAPITITGGTRVFVDPEDADHTLFAFGSYFDGHGTDLYRSADGLDTLEMSNFKGFDTVFNVAFSPLQDGSLVVGVSSNAPSE